MDRDPDHAQQGPQADAELRRRARAQFLSGRFEASRVVRSAGGGEPAADTFRTRLRAEFADGSLERRAASRQVLREALAGAAGAADASYRSRLAARFVLGELEPAVVENRPVQAPLAPIHDLGRARRRLGPGLVAGLLAAAALLLATLPGLLGPVWMPRPDADVTGVVFDRQPLDRDHALRARTDRVLACGPEALRLSLEDRALVQLSPAAQIRFCAPVWTLFGDVRAPVHVDAGTLDLQTLQGEEDLDLELDTPNAVVRLDRGALSVRVVDRGTCIVVARGTARVRAAGSGEEVELTEGQRLFVPRDGSPCALEDDYATANPEAESRLRSMRAMLVDVEAGVF